MTSGGHGNSGPPPDPMALRRNRPSDRAEWVTLEREHDLQAPPWPLPRATRRETRLWAEEWRRPQAVMWAANGWEREVALYVRTLIVAEAPKAPVNSRILVRQFMESLGISGDGLRRNRWRIRPQGDGPRTELATGTEGRANAPAKHVPATRWKPEVIDGGG